MDRRATVAGITSISSDQRRFFSIQHSTVVVAADMYSAPQPRGPLFHIETATLSTLRGHRTRRMLLFEGIGSVGRHHGCYDPQHCNQFMGHTVDATHGVAQPMRDLGMYTFE